MTVRYDFNSAKLNRSVEASLSYKDDVHFGLGDNPADIQNSFSLLNLSATVEHPASHTGLRLFARNVFDKTFAARLTPNNGAILQFFPMEARASIGLSVEKRF